ncbi:Uncharacterized protein C8034_v000205 [Colletotrichum sidae]|uniref:UspA domain-containing protein n=1 Tax=Colletotrichum sidae TaxID=1347389 RepID=A0A4R8TP56_9PEZI|nr:Uncharacterized protein C8034_v000205 [Colletotrichum sidae]
MSHQPMSLEAMLDEERRDVLALLEGSSNRPTRNPGSPVAARSPSPYTSPRSPVRSMLDVGFDPNKRSPATGPAVPVRSMLDIGAPPAAPVRSMLDINTSGPKQIASAGPSSPVESRAPHPRTFSDSHSGPKPNFGPRAPVNRMDPTQDFQFSDIATNNIGQAMPKRNTQGGKKSGVMADVMRGNDIPGIVLPGDRARHGSIASNPVMPSGRSSSRGQNSKSKSPHGRLSMRSRSPNVGGRLQQIPGTAVLDDGRVVDITTAYRKLSDANLVFSGSGLSEIAARKKLNPDDRSAGRLTKDYLSPDGEELEDSSDEEHDDSDEEQRGRKMSTRAAEHAAKSPDTERKTLSLLAAAEEERIEVSSQPQYKYRSLLDDPQITVTKPKGEKSKPSKSGVHPTTAFDQGPGSGPASAVNSDDEEELTDIKRAQRLGFSHTPIQNQNEHSRTLRIIYRGEYDKIQKAAEDEHHRLRKYLVATDLSDESTHALEWAIGTVLRDGDTLICMYCVDEEAGIYSTDGILVPDEPKAHKEQAAAINALSNAKTPPPNTTNSPIFPYLPRASALNSSDSHSTPSPAPSSRERGRAEEERFRAVDDITDRVTRLLRKTRLQVRVIVEVLHCKNPKHLITEIIDLVNPTLVILGSRGRSALKGVILGSFSNYLVTKSSVPVMVARKRLRKQSKYKRPVKQVNMLNTPGARSLANAKVD